jgi:uncharacterized protein (DUF885 family)
VDATTPEPRPTPADHPDAPPAADGAAGREVRRLADRYWELTLAAHPTAATLLGVHDHDDRIEDLSEAAEAAHREALTGIRAEVATVDPARLGASDRVTRSLLLHQLDVGIEAAELRLVELASDQMVGPHAELLMTAPQLTYPEPAHALAALERYAQVPRLLDQAVERFRAGAARGRTPAACVLERSLNSLTQYLRTDLATDPFPAAGLPDGWDGADDWREQVAALVRDQIRPAFERYRDALRDELAGVARADDRAGWCWLDDGAELYGAVVRGHTTLGRSPQELHDLGRHHTEVVLPAEYAEVGGRTWGETDPAAVMARLRSDPALLHRDAEEILRVAIDTVARATAAMAGWFGRLPGSPCEVTPVPDFLAADAPYAYYFPPATDGTRPGTYFINTSDPEHASRTEAESIAFHEAIPGHHLQIAISQELDALPDFQRHEGSTAYVEGWGLYAERLADEMGLYSGDLDRLGMLTADSWRSARLVVDTGLHHLGWSRQQALDYFAAHTPVPLEQVAPEVDRYLAMPAQALAYKVGQLEIQRVRADAAERLGDRFDLPGFHDAVLGSGAVTLPVLAELVEAWVAERSAG